VEARNLIILYSYFMSLLDNIKTGPKLQGVVKFKLPKQTTVKTGGKWKILNTQAPLQNLMKRVAEYVAANTQGKKQRDTALNSMLSTLSSNKYNKMHKLLIIGALSERKNLPFVNSLLQKFSEDQIKNGISALNSLRKTGRIKGNEYGIPPPPPPPPPPKKPSPKKSTPKKLTPKKPSPKKPTPKKLSQKSLVKITKSEIK
jgi:hypothetical protein